MRIFILLSLVYIVSCSPKYYCKRCPSQDSIVYQFDTLKIKGDTVTLKADCLTDTVIVQKEGRLEIRTVIKNRIVEVQGTCDSIQEVYYNTIRTITRKEITPIVPLWSKILIGSLIAVILGLLYAFIKSLT